MQDQFEKAPGMGSIYSKDSTTFRVWAPNASAVSVVGDFNDWKEAGEPLEKESDNGYWACAVAGVKPGQKYAFRITNGGSTFDRVDPYARRVDGEGEKSVSVVVDRDAFDWEGDDFRMPKWNEMVIYELHVGSFKSCGGGKPGTFGSVQEQLPYLHNLGVNCIKIMPPAEFDGKVSWGYNPNYPFAVETAYGGPEGLKKLVKAAHQHGIAIIIDVVYNHLGPSGHHLWQFDGWGEGNYGGIYFYNDERAKTPWGDTRLNYGSPEVRQYLIDNALMWLEEYRADGLRVDSVSHIRAINGDPSDPAQDLPDGWHFLQEMNNAIDAKFPWKMTVAEDLLCNDWVTKSTAEGGAGFDSQWDCNFIYPVREVLTAPNDSDRHLDEVQKALTFMYGGNAFSRVIFTESHDAVSTEQGGRLVWAIDADDTEGYFATKRAIMALVLAATAPGIPMIFQGQEFLDAQPFAFPDNACLNWELAGQNEGVVRLVSDAFKLRRNLEGRSAGLTGSAIEVTHRSQSDDMIVFHRWLGDGGERNNTVIVANFSAEPKIGYRIGFPSAGRYDTLLNTDARTYRGDFSDIGPSIVDTADIEADGNPASAMIDVGPYSILILALA